MDAPMEAKFIKVHRHVKISQVLLQSEFPKILSFDNVA